MITLDFLILSLRDATLSFIIAVGFGILFNTPRKVLLAAGLLGGFGHMLRFMLLHTGLGLVTATMIGAMSIALLGIYVARWLNAPPVIFTMPASITMIPGLYAYRSMLGFIKIVTLGEQLQNSDLLAQTTYHLLLTVSLLFTLAISITIGALLFRQKSTRMKK